MADVINAMALMALGMMSSQSDIRAALCIASLAILCGEISYVVKGIWNPHTVNGSSNDFAKLKCLGIPPIFPILGIAVLIGIVVKVMFFSRL